MTEPLQITITVGGADVDVDVDTAATTGDGNVVNIGEPSDELFAAFGDDDPMVEEPIGDDS